MSFLNNLLHSLGNAIHGGEQAVAHTAQPLVHPLVQAAHNVVNNVQHHTNVAQQAPPQRPAQHPQPIHFSVPTYTDQQLPPIPMFHGNIFTPQAQTNDFGDTTAVPAQMPAVPWRPDQPRPVPLHSIRYFGHYIPTQYAPPEQPTRYSI